LCSRDHASFGDACDLACAGSELLHADRSGAAATTNARLTSFAMLRILVTVSLVAGIRPTG
jgi:hypothetical protein